MRRAFVLVFLVTAAAMAVDYEADSSSNAVQASTVLWIPNSSPGDILMGVVVNTHSSAAETLKIYDSSGSANGLIGTLDVSTGALSSSFVHYALRISSGITLTKSGAISDLTILWKNVR